ncbi:MAG TPA: Gfo/Idh/MocA family oxidoreductase [Steroidobacteraceae bacterium]|nr:Gfo/Idh/MocA family oxidoreductase [Steroidobacteraceae bacterium]
MPTRSRRSPRRRNESKGKPIRYAVLGLGYISQIAMLPAFQHAKRNSVLTALVSGDPKKLKALGRRYGVTNLYSYDDVDDLYASGEIDAVYIGTPNSRHKDDTVRAANAGIHVLCEKPMASTREECEEMIAAAKENRVKLMVAYRLHFERANLEAGEIARSGKLGDPRFFTSQFSQQVGAGNVRLKSELGGGPVWDVGIYCINAARAVFAAEPLEVLGATVSRRDARFREVPETVTVAMRFPKDRIASFTCSFGAAHRSVYEVVGTNGSITLDPAYEFAEGLSYQLRIGDRERERHFGKSDQFAPELLHFADCIRQNREPGPSGEEGLADVRVILAIHQSIEAGRWVALDLPTRARRPSLAQEERRPGVEPPKLVNAASPQSAA